MFSWHVSSHPLLLSWLSELREKNTPPQRFRRLLRGITQILIHEATSDLPLSLHSIETPLEKIDESPVMKERLVFISIMRAGNAMLDTAIDMLDLEEVGHIGFYRKTAGQTPVEYFFKVPPQLDQARVFLLDPMLATGSSAAAAIEKLKNLGVQSLDFICLVAAPEGLKRLREIKDCRIRVFGAALDRELNQKNYILPGLGDAGDRIYGTLQHS